MNKQQRRLIILIFILILVNIIFFVILNRNYLEGIIEIYVQKYGLIAILILSLLADSMDQPIGPEVPASLGVVFGLNIFLVVLFSVVGSWIASVINYYIGKGYFSDYLKKSYDEEKYNKYSNMFKKYGGWAVFLAAVSPVPWTLFCWLAGSFKMKLKRFFAWGLIPRIFRIFIIVGIVDYFKIFF